LINQPINSLFFSRKLLIPGWNSATKQISIVRSDLHIFVEFWRYGRNVAEGGPPEPVKLFKLSLREKFWEPLLKIDTIWSLFCAISHFFRGDKCIEALLLRVTFVIYLSGDEG